MSKVPNDDTIKRAAKMFDLMVEVGVKPGDPVKVFDERGKLLDFGYVIRAYYDDGPMGETPPAIRVGINSVLHGRDMYYDHEHVVGTPR